MNETVIKEEPTKVTETTENEPVVYTEEQIRFEFWKQILVFFFFSNKIIKNISQKTLDLLALCGDDKALLTVILYEKSQYNTFKRIKKNS